MTKQEILELIKRRRYQIITHSFIYYRLNDNLVSDEQFDDWANELISLQTNYPDLSREVEDYYDAFRNFTDVSDAASLPLDGDEVLASRAKRLIANR